ncbi:hypothetical protein [Sulfurimonas sp.]|uniref:hypothetical protein n=1 Tax=Sulfurimonas sp. TaxID=2022749 RepID=UPI003D0ADB23
MSFSKKSIALLMFIASSFLYADPSICGTETIAFTESTIVSLSPVQSPIVSSNLCENRGTCATELIYNSDIGGKIVVTATDGGSIDDDALAHQSKCKNAGLGVVSGHYCGTEFKAVDTFYALNKRNEKLTITFETEVSLDAIYFFPDERVTDYLLSHLLEPWDGFSVSIDGGEFVTYSFGKEHGQPMKFVTPLTGKSFTFSYPDYMGIEDYYIGAVTISCTGCFTR